MFRFEASCAAVPPGARVDDVDVDDEVPSGTGGEFTIRS